MVGRACDEAGNPAPVKAPRTVELPSIASEGLCRRRTVQTAYLKRHAKSLMEHETGQAAVRSDALIVSTPEGKPIRPRHSPAGGTTSTAISR